MIVNKLYTESGIVKAKLVEDIFFCCPFGQFYLVCSHYFFFPCVLFPLLGVVGSDKFPSSFFGMVACFGLFFVFFVGSSAECLLFFGVGSEFFVSFFGVGTCVVFFAFFDAGSSEFLLTFFGVGSVFFNTFVCISVEFPLDFGVPLTFLVFVEALFGVGSTVEEIPSFFGDPFSVEISVSATDFISDFLSVFCFFGEPISSGFFFSVFI